MSLNNVRVSFADITFDRLSQIVLLNFSAAVIECEDGSEYRIFIEESSVGESITCIFRNAQSNIYDYIFNESSWLDEENVLADAFDTMIWHNKQRTNNL